MIDEVLDWLNGTRGAAPGRFSTATIAGMYRASPKVVMIAFRDNGAPGAVVKIARDVRGEPMLTAEREALERFARHAAPAFLRAAPEPFAFDRVAGRMALAASVVPGVPMTARYYSAGHTRTRRRVVADFAAASGWLSAFHRQTTLGRLRLGDHIDTAIAPTIDRYRHEIGSSAGEEDLWDGVLARARALGRVALPRAGRHGDFWMGNIMCEGSAVRGVVDWELAELGAVPLDDVYKFPTSYASYLDRAYGHVDRVPGHPAWRVARARWSRYGSWANLAGFGYAFFGAGWFPALVRSFIDEQLRALGVPRAVNTVFFPLFLARQAMTLEDPVFRSGYRAALQGFSSERSSTWLWHDVPGSVRVG